MVSIKFISNYDHYLNEISLVLKPEHKLHQIIEELQQMDINNLFHTDHKYQSSGDMRGFVWSLFVEKALYNSNFHQP